MHLRKLDHIGIAVPALAEARAFWEGKLGLHAKGEEDVPSQRVRVCFLPIGESKLELLEPTSPDSTIAKFLEKRGPGLHHVAFEVPDIRAALAEAKAQGIQLIDQEPRPGAANKLVAFLHPRDTGGVLTELVQPAPKA
ncbi:MAG: methylmalonyl-CoA epimerase [Halobacteriales archaeon]|nr:methylmalonyl-CoA epimerase [Halobacteriales archaeon]